MATWTRIGIKPQLFFEQVIRPNLGDLIPGTNYYIGMFGEFQVLDDVSSSATLLDMKQERNILRRRDASCLTVPAPVASTGTSKISVTEVYGKTVWCREKFYQGDLKDWRANDPVFVQRILEYFRNAFRDDMISNMYLGDTEKPVAVNPGFSYNVFDGIVTKYMRAAASGKIPAGQQFTIPNGAITGNQAFTYFSNLYNKQSNDMKLVLRTEKAFYVDQDLADAYEDYLVTLGATSNDANNYVQNGVAVRAFKGIPIFVNPFFGPILQDISGNQAHFAVLTVRGNHAFATDRSYGEGPNGDQAMMVWYSWEDLQWKYVAFAKAGVGIAAVDMATVALPA